MDTEPINSPGVTPTPLTNILPEKPKRKLFKFLVPVIVIVIIIIAAALYFFVFGGKEEVNDSATSNSTQPTTTPTPTASASQLTANLNDYPNKELLAANDTFSVYATDKISATPTAATVKLLLINDRDTNKTIKVNYDSTISILEVLNSKDKKYLIISNGTYVYRGATVYNLTTGNKIASLAHIGGNQYNLFWKNYLLYLEQGSTRYADVPQVSVAALNLNTGKTTYIAKADALTDYNPYWRNFVFTINYFAYSTKSVTNILGYSKYSASTASDWQSFVNSGLTKSPKYESVSFDLSTLPQ